MMETKSQKEVRKLLRLEKSAPILVDAGKLSERIQWRLPDDKIHRDFGPAIEYANRVRKAWYQYGLRHREDGPALIDDSLGPVEKYYIKGCCVSKEEFDRWKLKNKKK